MRLVRYLSVLLACLAMSNFSYADMMKCPIGNSVWNYFDSSDVKQQQKCLAPAISVLASGGNKINNKYSNSAEAEITKANPNSTLLAAKDVKPTCGGSGGTIVVEGKVFHFDEAALCKRYSKDKKGSIEYGTYIASNSTLNAVDEKYQKTISPYVARVALKHSLDPAFIHAIISAESGYNPKAVSNSGAKGLMQLMPLTAKRFGVTNVYDPYQNIEAGASYLQVLYNEFGSLELAAAGYNAGEGSVRKYNNNIPPYVETQNYVPRVMAFYHKYKNNNTLISAK